MTRISALFSRRGFNIESLSVGHTETPGKSRFTIVVQGDDMVLEQIRKQLQKLINVIKVWDIKHADAVEREHALIKLQVQEGMRAGNPPDNYCLSGPDRRLDQFDLDPRGYRGYKFRGQRL